MKLNEFVMDIKQKPVPTAVVSGGQIIDGATNAEWTPEQITAEAFNQEILSVDTDTWETAIEKVRKILLEPGNM